MNSEIIEKYNYSKCNNKTVEPNSCILALNGIVQDKIGREKIGRLHFFNRYYFQLYSL